LDELLHEKEPGLVRAGKQLFQTMAMLEKHYRYPQDVEFTIQQGNLYMLQTRSAKRVGIAGVRWAVELATGQDVITGEKRPKLLTPKAALQTVTGSDLEQLLFPIFDAAIETKKIPFVTGLPAGPGAAVGAIVLSPEMAEQIKKKNPSARLILVREETSPEDIGGMDAAEGILTSTGGMTSHAAVVARGWGKCCVCGAGDLKINLQKKTISAGNHVFKEGDTISLNGSTGRVYAGEIPTESSPVVAALVDEKKNAREHWIFKLYQQISQWSDQYRQVKVRANADTPTDSVNALAFGAEGIGLCRTEHMFFGDRITDMRRFILADTDKQRKSAVARLLPHQRKDFEGIFRVMDGKPVTIRLLDPPLHEFLPHLEADMKTMAKEMNLPLASIQERVKELHEFNPMLGHRGCRLSISYPELCIMQTTAIIEAAIKEQKRGTVVIPEIMVPLIGTKPELDFLEKIIRETADAIITKANQQLKYLVGTMIEIPRAALTAEQIAQTAEFFSFGTNDLTQMTYGFSRDDIGKSFLPHYVDNKILDYDPFQRIDETGVGQLIEMAVAKGRKARPDLKCGICGEHGGEPDSVKFCVRTGLDYVSCSPFRVPIARLAAAQAEIGS
jgi:pyruvate,orthophosphate dikinase